MKIKNLIPSNEFNDSSELYKFISIFDDFIDSLTISSKNRFTKNNSTILEEDLFLHLADYGIDDYVEDKRTVLKNATNIIKTKGLNNSFKFFVYYSLGYLIDIEITHSKMLDICDDINSSAYDPNNQFMINNLDTENDIISYCYNDSIVETSVDITVRNYDNDSDKINKLDKLIKKYYPVVAYKITY